MIVTRNIKMDLGLPNLISYIDVVQDDKYTRNLAISLYQCSSPLEPPAGTVVLVRYKKPDGKGGEYDTLPDGSVAYSIDDNVVTVALAPQVLTVAGTVELTVTLIHGTQEISMFPILLRVCANVGAMIAASESYTNVTGFVPTPTAAKSGQFLRVLGVSGSGKVTAVESVDLEQAVLSVPVSDAGDTTDTDGNLLRHSFHLGGRIRLGSYAGYRINKLGIRATAGTAVRFALYAMDDTVMTQLAVLGEAVADSEGRAVLTFGDGYGVRQDDTIILAFAQSAALHCYRLDSGLTVFGVAQFEDADYFGNADGDRIAYTEEEMDSGEAVAMAMFARDLDFLTEQTLEEYFRSVDGRIKALEDAGPQSGVTSWNDLTDKPFYEEATEEVLREYTALDGFAPLEDYGGRYGKETAYPGFDLVLGETYVIMWDGLAFECVAQDMSNLIEGAIGVGDLSMFPGGSGNGETFAIGYIDGAAVFLDMNTENPKTSHEIGVTHMATLVKELDEKFLPEGTATETYVQQYVESYIGEALGGDY